MLPVALPLLGVSLVLGRHLLSTNQRHRLQGWVLIFEYGGVKTVIVLYY